MFFSTVKNDFRLNAFRTKKNTSQKTFRVPSNDSLKSMTELAVVAFFLMIVGDICIAIATGAPALRTPIPPVHNTQVHNVGTVHSDWYKMCFYNNNWKLDGQTHKRLKQTTLQPTNYR